MTLTLIDWLIVAASLLVCFVPALFFAQHLVTGSTAEALSLAASSLFGVLSRTAEQGASEMLLVEAQEEFVMPRRIFKARPI